MFNCQHVFDLRVIVFQINLLGRGFISQLRIQPMALSGVYCGYQYEPSFFTTRAFENVFPIPCQHSDGNRGFYLRLHRREFHTFSNLPEPFMFAPVL